MAKVPLAAAGVVGCSVIVVVAPWWQEEGLVAAVRPLRSTVLPAPVITQPATGVMIFTLFGEPAGGRNARAGRKPGTHRRAQRVRAPGGTLPRWRFEAEGDLVTTPVLDRGILLVGDTLAVRYALDAATGTVRWRYASGEEITPGGGGYREVDSPLVPGDGALYLRTSCTSTASPKGPADPDRGAFRARGRVKCGWCS